MATINISVDYPIEDGMNLTFTAPCNCSAVTGLKVTYPVITETDSTSTSKTFAFKDAHNNNLSSTNNLFVQGAIIKVILNVTNSYAYIQNADTNAYLEGKFTSIGSDMSTLNTNLTNVTHSLSVANGNIVTMNTNISALESAVSTINSNISTINANIEALWYKPGDIVNFASVWIAGVITGGGKVFDGWLPVAKPLKDNVATSTPLTTSGTAVTLRSVQGYILNHKPFSDFLNEATINFAPRTHGFKVRIDFSEQKVTNTNNNTPATLTFTELNLSLSA